MTTTEYKCLKFAIDECSRTDSPDIKFHLWEDMRNKKSILRTFSKWVRRNTLKIKKVLNVSRFTGYMKGLRGE